MKAQKRTETSLSAASIRGASRRMRSGQSGHLYRDRWPERRIGLALLLGALIVVAGCNQGAPSAGYAPTAPSAATTSATATASAGSSATATVTAVTVATATATAGGVTLGAAPQNCASAATLTFIDSSIGSGVGESPIWGVGVSGPPATLRLGANAKLAANGWQGQLTIVAKVHAPGPLVLQGQLIQGNYPPVWFQYGTQQATTEIGLNLTQPGPGSTSAYEKYPTTIWVPQAGCYQIIADWPTGSWSAVIGIGR